MTTKTELISMVNDHTRYLDNGARLYKCNAHILEFSHNGKAWGALRSYNTVVACFSYSSGTLYVFDKYSATTYQHVYKYSRYIGCDRISWLYARYDRVVETPTPCGTPWKVSKNQINLLLIRDWEGQIESV